MPASFGVRLALRRFQSLDAVTTFSQLVRPPRDRGRTWSKVRSWAAGLADVGVSLAALAIIVEVLGMGVMPFMGDVSVIGNVSSIMSSLGSEGLIGLVAVWILWSIWERK